MRSALPCHRQVTLGPPRVHVLGGRDHESDVDIRGEDLLFRLDRCDLPREGRLSLDPAMDRRDRFAMPQRHPVAHGRQLPSVVAQMAAGSSAQRFFAVVQQVFRAEVRDDTRRRESLAGEQRKTFLKPAIPAQQRKLGCELKGQLEVLRKKTIGRKSVRPDGGARGLLRRRPTAGKRSFRLQPSNYLLL